MASKTNQFLHLAFLILTIWASSSSMALRILNDELPMSVRHEQWMAEFGREYVDAVEKELRFNIFKDNVEYIESVNKAGDRKYKLGINRFADFTHEDFKAYNGFLPKTLGSSTPVSFRNHSLSLSDVPPSVDWRANGAVTGIKNQGQSCGSCWAFSAIGATEGIIQIKKSSLTPLSEQQLVDCVNIGDTRGCSGGLVTDAFQYMINNGGISSEDNYPYKAQDGTCNTAAASVAAITGYENVPSNSESALLAAVAAQPVSVAIEGGGRDFMLYAGGVFTGQCGTTLNHAVTAIGYGTESDGTKYWLVKNSWGASWGEGGYAKMQRDVSAPEGLCGIAMKASYPTV